MLSVVNEYKYIGVIFNEFVKFNVTADILSGAAKNGTWNNNKYKYKHINGLGLYIYTTLYNNGVCPILDYCSKV